jgi:hypothetical protein
MPAPACQTILNAVQAKKTFYCPSTAPTYSDKENFLDPYPNSLWYFNFPPGTSEDNKDFFHIVGYTFALNGDASKLNERYQNKKILGEGHTTGGGASFMDNVADRVLIADINISDNNAYPATSDKFRDIWGGFIKPHLSAHLSRSGIPSGSSITYKDGHSQWKKFKSAPGGFSVPGNSPWLSTEDTYSMVRTTSGPYFWW